VDMLYIGFGIEELDDPTPLSANFVGWVRAQFPITLGIMAGEDAVHSRREMRYRRSFWYTSSRV